MTSCEQDIVEKEKLHQESHAKINPHEVNLDFFREQTGIIDLDEFYTKTIKVTRNRKSASAALDSISLDDFTIDKEHILMKIRSDSTTQVFTFRLDTDSISLRTSEYYNLVIAVDDEGGLHYQAYYLEEDTGENSDSYFSTIRSLGVNKGELDRMLGKSGFSRVCSDTYTFHCPAPGNCDPDGGCDLCSDCVTVTVNCDWVYTSSPLTPVEEHFADEFVVNRPGGGGSKEEDDDEEDNDEEEDRKNGCDAINDHTVDIDSTSAVSKFQKQMKRVGDSIPHKMSEVALFMFKNETEIKRSEGATNNGRTTFRESNNKLLAYYHIHNNAPGGTYSVFSYGDLDGLAKQIVAGKIKTRGFVAFLSTHHGTNYAMHIKDVTAYKSFFVNRYAKPPAPNESPAERAGRKNREISNKTKYKKLIMDYYLGSSSIIEQTSTDTEGQLLQFMEFLEQANLGVEFYESSSTDFSDPVKIEVENNQIKRTPCDD